MDKKPIEIYKTFIDGVVDLRPGVYPSWILGDGWPKLPDNEKVNKVLSELSPEQKQVFAYISQASRDDGIHDVLVYLTDQINIEGVEILKDGIKMAVEPFDSGMHYDWVCRKEGDQWLILNSFMKLSIGSALTEPMGRIFEYSLELTNKGL